MELLELCKDEYQGELDRRNEIRRSLTLPIGLSVLFGGAIYSLLAGFPWAEVEMLTLKAFLTVSIPGILFWAAAVIFLIRAHVGFSYGYVPTAKEIIEYKEALVLFYGDKGCEDQSQSDVEAYLQSEFSNTAHHNFLNNNSKAAYLHEANRRLVVVLIALGLMSLVHLINPFLEILYDK